MQRWMLVVAAGFALAAAAAAGPKFQAGDVVQHRPPSGDPPRGPGYRVVGQEGGYLFAEDLGDPKHYVSLDADHMVLLRRPEPMPEKGPAAKVEPKVEPRAPAGPAAGIKVRFKGTPSVPGVTHDAEYTLIGIEGDMAVLKHPDGSTHRFPAALVVKADGSPLAGAGPPAPGPDPRVTGGDRRKPVVSIHDPKWNVYYFIPADDKLELDKVRRAVAAGERLTYPLVTAPPGPVVGEEGGRIPAAGIPCPNGRCPSSLPPYRDYARPGGFGGSK